MLPALRSARRLGRADRTVRRAGVSFCASASPTVSSWPDTPLQSQLGGSPGTLVASPGTTHPGRGQSRGQVGPAFGRPTEKGPRLCSALPPHSHLQSPQWDTFAVDGQSPPRRRALRQPFPSRCSPGTLPGSLSCGVSCAGSGAPLKAPSTCLCQGWTGPPWGSEADPGPCQAAPEPEAKIKNKNSNSPPCLF